MTDNLSIKIYVNKIENKITSRIKTGYYLKPFVLETMKLLGSAKRETVRKQKMKMLKTYLI